MITCGKGAEGDGVAIGSVVNAVDDSCRTRLLGDGCEIEVLPNRLFVFLAKIDEYVAIGRGCTLALEGVVAFTIVEDHNDGHYVFVGRNTKEVIEVVDGKSPLAVIGFCPFGFLGCTPFVRVDNVFPVGDVLAFVGNESYVGIALGSGFHTSRSL